MKKTVLLALLSALFLTSCGGAPKREFSLVPHGAQMELGETRTLSVTSAAPPVFTSSDEEVASVDENGTVCARSAGTAVITASADGESESCTVTVTAAPVGEGLGMLSLVWNDEFFDSSPDGSKWDFQLGTSDEYHGKSSGPRYWGNNEQQYYTREAVRTEGGYLHITARREERGDRNFTSGRILTRDKFCFTYGYVEAKMSLPAEQGMWPAFWMLPQPSGDTTDNVYGGWAANGEIDIMEAKGRLSDRVAGTLHFGNRGSSTYLTRETPVFPDIGYEHVYGLEWRKEYIAWRVDGEEFFRVGSDDWWTASAKKEENAAAPFDQPFYLLFNLAVGGNFDGGILPAPSFTSAEMKIDYVRVYS